MQPTAARRPRQPAPTPRKPSARVDLVVASLRRLGTKRNRDGMARYAIPSDKAFGVPISTLHRLAKQLGRDHDLAAALWNTGWYEARLLAAFVEEPARVTAAQMDGWCRQFDNWAIVDTVCFHLFDRTPHAWSKVEQWARRREEFVKRAAFALLASLTAHDKAAGDARFVRGLALIERAADDGRNFVAKGVNWSLRCIGKRNPALHAAAVEVSRRLSASPGPSARWVGRDALRELTSAAVTRRLAARGRAAGATARRRT